MVFDNFQCARHSFVASGYFKAHHGWAQRKIFQNKDSQMAGTRHFEIGFANTVNTSYFPIRSWN